MTGSDWADINYSKRRKLSIDGSLVSGNLTDFPILYSSTSYLDGINPSGIKFYDSGNTVQYSHEYDYWNSGTGNLVAWIKLPKIISGTTTLNTISSNTLWIYYDSPTATADTQNIADVWSNDFLAVYHMNDHIGNTLMDSVGTQSGSKGGTNYPTQVNGRIGASGAQLFNSGNIDISGLADTTKDWTFSWWIFIRDEEDKGKRLLDIQSGRLTFYELLGSMKFYDGGLQASISMPPYNEWVNLALTAKDNVSQFYLSGITHGTAGGYTDRNIGGTIKLMSRYESADSVWYYMSGMVDEFRIAKTERSQEWLFTEYQNQSDPTSFITEGAEETLSLVVTNASGCVASGVTTATLSARVLTYSGNVFIYYDTVDNGEVRGDWPTSANCGLKYYDIDNGYVTSGITDLNGRTTYYYRAYITSNGWGGGEDWASVTSFKTQEVTVTNASGALSQTNRSATFTGKVIIGSGNVDIYWGTTNGSTIKGNWDTSGNLGVQNDYFTLSQAGLSGSTRYYYRSYITSQGWSGGEDWAPSSAYFTTLPNVSTNNASGALSIGTDTAILTSKVFGSSGSVFIYYDTSDHGENKSLWTYSANCGTRYIDDYITSSVANLSDYTTYYYRSYITSNGWYRKEDWANTASRFTTLKTKTRDLQIYGSSNYFIDCWCSRWDVQNYSVIVETWMKKADLQTLKNNTVPGAVKELYRILGRPRYYDQTWTASNTIKLSPNPAYQLSNMRSDTLVFPRNIVSGPYEGESGWINVKIESYVSGVGDL